MSLILDALKKSDNERQRTSTPSIADVRVAAQPSSAPPNWLWWLLGLLALNLLILMIVLLRSGDEPENETRTAVLPAVNNERQQPRQAEPAPVLPYKEEVRSLSREAGGSASEVATATAAAKTTQAAPNPAPAPVSVTPNTKPSTRSKRIKSDSDLTLPSYEDLRASGAIDLPSMHIDLHVYNAQSSSRLIYINGKKYAQGDTTVDGPHIEEIRQDGAKMSYRGNDFLLPRD